MQLLKMLALSNLCKYIWFTILISDCLTAFNFLCRKIFVGGIAVSTTKNRLINYFEYYGNVIDCIIMVDRDHSKRAHNLSLLAFIAFNSLSLILMSISLLSQNQEDLASSLLKTWTPLNTVSKI